MYPPIRRSYFSNSLPVRNSVPATPFLVVKGNNLKHNCPIRVLVSADAKNMSGKVKETDDSCLGRRRPNSRITSHQPRESSNTTTRLGSRAGETSDSGLSFSFTLLSVVACDEEYRAFLLRWFQLTCLITLRHLALQKHRARRRAGGLVERESAGTSVGPLFVGHARCVQMGIHVGRGPSCCVPAF